jgi:hypothetical protein
VNIDPVHVVTHALATTFAAAAAPIASTAIVSTSTLALPRLWSSVARSLRTPTLPPVAPLPLSLPLSAPSTTPSPVTGLVHTFSGGLAVLLAAAALASLLARRLRYVTVARPSLLFTSLLERPG